MSMHIKSGKIISVADHAVHDYFVRKDVVNLILEQENGEQIVARMPVGEKFEWSHNPGAGRVYAPSIGDTVEIGWDYSRFRGVITDPTLGPRQIIPDDIPVAASRAFPADDILDSLNPPDSDAD